MPVPYLTPDKLPAKMCEIPGCPYRRRCQRGGKKDICQQHGRMYDKHGRFDLTLNLQADELKYTRAGYPDPDGDSVKRRS